MTNAITVDVEEYYHATNLDEVVGPARWHSMPSRVDGSTRHLIDLFARQNARGTFFVLGCVARRWPQLIKDIAAAGHEVASHGYAHRLAYEQTPKAFARDVQKSKFLLEDLIGSPILGYRAPNFSIVETNQWAYDALFESGYKYDSSVYPTWHPRYSNTKKPARPYKVRCKNGELLVFPLSVAPANIARYSFRIPVAGGAYWRLFPFWLLRWGLQQAEKNGGLNCYIHPWEVDIEQPRFDELSLLTRVRHYGGIHRLPGRIEAFLKMFRFVPLRELMSAVP